MKKELIIFCFLALASIIIIGAGCEKIYCGDNTCNGNETQASCCMDCGCSVNYTCVNNTCIQNITQNNTNQTEKFCGNLTSDEIITIAQGSTCTENGTINTTKEFYCNNYTQTAWLGLNLVKSGCNPACVVNVVTRQAEINWRCTGLNPEPEESCKGMTLTEALAIAEESECIDEGTIDLTKEKNCNENGYWWLGLDLFEPKPLCNPACVVDVASQEAEINWRCGGAVG